MLRILSFQGTFDKNVLTFNPGWDRDAHPLAEELNYVDGKRMFLVS